MKAFISCLGITALFLAGAISCNKDNGGPIDPTLPDTTCKVASVRFTYEPYFDLETKMLYDTYGRLVKVTDYDSSRPRWSGSFEYSAGKVIEIDSAASYGGNVIDMQSVVIHHEIGANGFAAISYFYNYNGVRDTTFYTYDADGYLTKLVHKHYSYYPPNPQHLDYLDTYTYTISAGNRVKEALNGKTYAEYEYAATPSKFGGFNFTNYSDYPFLGRKNVSLPQTVYSINPNDATVERHDYNYKLDTEGKPLVVRHSNITGSDSLVLSYVCK